MNLHVTYKKLDNTMITGEVVDVDDKSAWVAFFRMEREESLDGSAPVWTITDINSYGEKVVSFPRFGCSSDPDKLMHNVKVQLEGTWSADDLANAKLHRK